EWKCDRHSAAQGLDPITLGTDPHLLEDPAFALALLLVAALVVQLDARGAPLQLADATDVLLALTSPPDGCVELFFGDQVVELAAVTALAVLALACQVRQQLVEGPFDIAAAG